MPRQKPWHLPTAKANFEHCNTFILKCFLQFACTNLDGFQKEGGNFLNFLQKEGVLRKDGPSEKGEVQTLEETMEQVHQWSSNWVPSNLELTHT